MTCKWRYVIGTSLIKEECQLTFNPQEPTLASQATEKQALINSLPVGDDELYSTWKKLEAHKEFLHLQEVRGDIFDLISVL